MVCAVGAGTLDGTVLCRHVVEVGESNPKAVLTHSIKSDMSVTKHQEAAVDNAGPWPV